MNTSETKKRNADQKKVNVAPAENYSHPKRYCVDNTQQSLVNQNQLKPTTLIYKNVREQLLCWGEY